MAFGTYTEGISEIRPGTYLVERKTGDQAPPLTVGRVAVLLASAWGPLTPQVHNGPDTIEPMYGVTTGSGVAKGAALGGADEILTLRVGSGGVAGTLNLADGSAAVLGHIDGVNIGTRGNFRLGLADSLFDVTKRILKVYENDGVTLLQEIVFTKGGGDESANLAAAVLASNSPYVAFTKTAVGNGILAPLVPGTAVMASGANPTANGAAYIAGQNLLAPLPWAILVSDSIDVTIQAAMAGFVQQEHDAGNRRRLVVAEPTSVAWATRKTDAASYNRWDVSYVGNGFKLIDGTVVEGARAAARYAGMLSLADIDQSTTHMVVLNAIDLVNASGELTVVQIKEAISAGMVVFTRNAFGQVQVESGVTTLVLQDANHDAGWKKALRVARRYRLIDLIGQEWDIRIGQVNNNADGRATFIQLANGVIADMTDLGALDGGYMVEDPARPAAGDESWYILAVNDNDKIEKLYVKGNFSYSPIVLTTPG